jgi:hypothetical protein
VRCRRFRASSATAGSTRRERRDRGRQADRPRGAPPGEQRKVKVQAVRAPSAPLGPAAGQAAPRRDPLASALAARRAGGTASPVRGPDQASRRRSPRGRHGAPGSAGADGASPLRLCCAWLPCPALPMPEPIAGPFRASWPSVGNLVATDGESDVATDI